MQKLFAIVTTSKRNTAKRIEEVKMKKSEIITAAIAKIEASRPVYSDFIGLDDCSAKYDAAYSSWADECGGIVKHLNVALSVAISDEYLSSLEC